MFCGPIAAPGQPAGGGYEAANRRTCDALVRHGWTVVELPYPKAPRTAVHKLAAYAQHFVRAAAQLIRRRDDYDLLHLTPLNMHFAWAESLLLSCARWVGKPVLLDVRAGTFVRHYQRRGRLYQRIVDRSLRLATQVAVEGREYGPFVRQRTRQTPFYFPNYIDTPSLHQPLAERQLAPGDPIRLIYFGRLVREKGIETALQVLAALRARGHAASLTLIGNGSASYLRALQASYAGQPVEWAGSLSVEAILSRAAQHHFFLFASRHDGEGHSNALNEAMAVGLVPICSDQGFTRTVVGDAGAVLSRGAPAGAYALAVEAIVDAGRWTELSRRARSRVQSLFSEDANLPALTRLYAAMIAVDGRH